MRRQKVKLTIIIIIIINNISTSRRNRSHISQKIDNSDVEFSHHFFIIMKRIESETNRKDFTNIELQTACTFDQSNSQHRQLHAELEKKNYDYDHDHTRKQPVAYKHKNIILVWWLSTPPHHNVNNHNYDYDYLTTRKGYTATSV